MDELGTPNVSFRRPDFTRLTRGEGGKDYNDIHQLGGLEMVREQLGVDCVQQKPSNERHGVESPFFEPARNYDTLKRSTKNYSLRAA